MMEVYLRTLNKKKIIILNGDLNSLRCRQRNRNKDGLKVVSMNCRGLKTQDKTHKFAVELIKHNSDIV